MTSTTSNRATRLFWLVALGAMWFAIIRQFGPQWSFYPQYNYGWGVPFLCLYLFWERWGARPPAEAPRFRSVATALAAAAAVMLAVARWAHEANTSWRITTWAMAFCAVTVTLWSVYLAGGRSWTKHFAFPVAFFLVAVPWPALTENLVIQFLTQLNAAATVEVVNFIGIPAIQHGNVIEVSTGMVGIDEACSGIRSLQATLMIALFFGELYRFGVRRRITLAAIGAFLAMLFNLGRTTLLVTVAARQGIAAIGKWHDPAGVTILVGCFTGLWGAAVWLRQRAARPVAPVAHTLPPQSASPAFPVVLILWVIAMEAGTELWYRASESKAASATQWTIRWPADKPGIQNVEIAPRVRSELAYDEGGSVRWRDPADGTRWQGFFFHWLSSHTLNGRVKLQGVKAHRPDICLPAAGLTQTAALGVKWFDAGAFQLPFYRYVFTTSAGPIYVFYLFFEDGAQAPAQMLDNPRSRLAAAMAGVRGLGERMVEIAVDGPADQAAAEAAFARLLPQLVTPSAEPKPQP